MELKVHDQEILLHKLWKSGKLFDQPMHTKSGQSVEVIFGGIENLDSGPDFKDAIIKFSGKIQKGDVEIHFDASGWYAHGHHRDPRYNRVILHLISTAREEEKFIEREDGVQVPQLNINVENQKAKLWKSNPSMPGKQKTSSLVVAECSLRRCETSKILATIQSAGMRRFSEKVAQIKEDLISHSWDQLLYKKIFEALGYSKNQIPFRKLADTVTYDLLCSEMQRVSPDLFQQKCTALLFGAAGLLPSNQQIATEISDSETLSYVAPLRILWDQLSHRLEIKPMKFHEWQFFRLRPQNFPTRRMAGMVQLLTRTGWQGFLQGFLNVVRGNASHFERIISELETMLTAQSEGFWSNHYRFEHASQSTASLKNKALIGKDRARDIVINIVIPSLYLYACEANDGVLVNLLQEISQRYPLAADNAVVRTMKIQLFGTPSKRTKVMTSAVQQQGLLYLNKRYCKKLNCVECLELIEKGETGR
ncbi:MAG: DUF2851 family protein [bacterium]